MILLLRDSSNLSDVLQCAPSCPSVVGSEMYLISNLVRDCANALLCFCPRDFLWPAYWPSDLVGDSDSVTCF